jgi:hypothetical protein
MCINIKISLARLPQWFVCLFIFLFIFLSAGRDHHGRAFSVWMAGGGIKPGVYGSTDDYCWSVENPAETVHIRDFNATILHLLGIDYKQFSFPYQGLDQRITGVKPARIIKEIIA